MSPTSPSSTAPFFSAHEAMLSTTSSARRMSLCSCIKNFVDFMIAPFSRVPDRDGKDRDVRIANHLLGCGPEKNSIHAALPADRQNNEINYILICYSRDRIRGYSFSKDRFNSHLPAACLRFDLLE